MGIIVKRPIANGSPGAASSPSGDPDQYFRRASGLQRMGPLPDASTDRIALALGFTLAHDAVDTAIVGTRNPDHMEANLRMVDGGLDVSAWAVEELHRRFVELDEAWVQLG